MIRSCLGEQIVSELHVSLSAKKRKTNTGFSLLEVLIASSVFSVGLAGVAALLLTSINQSAQARREGLATMAAASLAEQIRLNPVALNHYLNPTDTLSKICLGIGNCLPGQQADYDFRLWQIELAEAIKSARGLVCHDATPMDGDAGDDRCDGAGPLVIKIFWTGPNRAEQIAYHRLTLEVA